MVTEALRGEAWAKAQIERDQPIRFPADWPEADRSISGAFVLDALIDARWAKLPDGFVLANAVVTTPVDRRYVQVPGELTFEDCTFTADVSLPYAKFERRVRFQGGVFAAGLKLNYSHAADLEFGESAARGSTVFQGPVDFRGTEIGGQLDCTKAQFLCEEYVVNFNTCKVGNLARFKEATFQGPVDFMGAEIGGELSCPKVQFLSREGEANFNGCKVTGHARFVEATFQGPADFGSAKIGGQLMCVKAQFRSQDGRVNFNGCTVTALAQFTEATFEGPVDFGGAEIGDQLICTNAQFRSPDREVIFNGCKVTALAQFTEASFDGPVDFGGAEIGSQLRCGKAQFLSLESKANFNNCRVGDTAFFEEAIFRGPVSFSGAKIGGQLVCIKTQFLSKRLETSFYNCQVKEAAFFQEAIFLGPVQLNFCKFSALWLAGAHFGGYLNLSHTSITGTLYMFTPGITLSEGATIEFPSFANLQGLVYDSTDLELRNAWRVWAGLRRSPDSYEPGPFFTLERSFRRAGQDDLADRVHYAMRRAEARHLWGLRRFDQVVWNWFLRGAVGYGVYGYRLILWALGLLGASYLGISWAQTQGTRFIQAAKGEATLPFSPFLYMVNLLLFNVGSLEKQYQPVGTWAFVEVAMRLCAWILVPMAIAQLAGLIKKKE
jgi:uncharacterized protein YjbI with pentapeptide repeats